MASVPSSPVLQLLRGMVEDAHVKGRSDEELLRQWAAGRDAACLHALVRRHGALVLNVCRTLLRNDQDAEDAFQATFLILAARAGSIRKTTSLASWLHGVAYRTVLKARAAFTRRRKHEARVPPRGATDPDELTWGEIQQVLHEELSRLAERDRAPLVLCYLQGKSQDEAAALLGVPRGTLKRWLERGRARLRARLVRRGLGPAAVLLTSAWPPALAPAAAPPTLVAATLRAAELTAAGPAAVGLISPTVTALADGGTRAMVFTTTKLTAALVVLVGVLGLGGATLLRQAEATGPGPRPRPAPGAEGPAPEQPVQRPFEDPQVVEAIKAAGGAVAYYKEGANRWTKVDFLEGKGDDASLALLKGLRHLQTLNLGKQFTEAGLAHLKDVRTIRKLSLVQCDVSDAGLAHLKGWADLELLNIVDLPLTGAGLGHLKGLRLKQIWVMAAGATRFDDAGMAELAGFPQLEVLNVLSPGVTDAGLAPLAGLARLRTLTLASDGVTDQGLVHLKALATGPLERLALSSRAVTDAGLDHLQGLAGLKHLDLYQTRVTDAGLLKLRGLKKLTGLRLDDTAVTDAGLAHLEPWSGSLEGLSLANTGVTDAGLVRLHGFTRLQHLNLTGTRVSAEALEGLRAALPKLKIER